MAIVNKPKEIRLGILPNWQQFTLLMATNAFVGGMAGLERAIVPLIGQQEFGLSSKFVIVSFIATFGISKAFANLAVGRLAERFSRRNLLIAGWLIGLPVPFLLMWANTWSLVLFANLLLGANQGLAWSMTVNMKIDLAGPRQRGMALGLNEMAGYMAVAAAAFGAGIIADRWGLRPHPFYLGIGLVAAGTALSTLWIRDTSAYVKKEMSYLSIAMPVEKTLEEFEEKKASPKHFAVMQAGFVNNFNDALVWGILPLYLVTKKLSIGEISAVAAMYPLIWGTSQALTGWISDFIGRKPLIVCGMVLQGLAIAGFTIIDSYSWFLLAAFFLGIGTAMVYPVLMAAISDHSTPMARSSALGRYRFWRDIGSAAGALCVGVMADIFGFLSAINAVAAVTILSGCVAAWLMNGRLNNSRTAAGLSTTGGT